MKASTFFSVLLLSILVVVVLEFSLYTDKTGQQNFSDTTEFTTYNKTDTLQRDIFNVVGVNSADDIIKITMDTKDFVSHDNMIDGIGNSSTCWHGYHEYSIKTTNSIPTYIVKHGDVNWSGWYEVVSIENKPH
jgi:hypothetical protein